MEVAFAFLCDYADNTGGKISAMGIGFDTIYAPKVPALHPFMYAVIGLRFSSVEVGQKQVGLRLIDADGTNIVPPLDVAIHVERPLEGYTYRGARIALGIHGMRFPQYGDYSVRWLLNGQEIANAPLRVAPPPPPVRTA